MAATWPALTPRGSEPDRQPGTDGTAADSGCATLPVRCKKRSSERSALTSDRMSPGLRRCAWNREGGDCRGRQAGQVRLAADAELGQEQPGESPVVMHRPGGQAPLAGQVVTELADHHLGRRRRHGHRGRWRGAQPAQIPQQRSDRPLGGAILVARRTAGQRILPDDLIGHRVCATVRGHEPPAHMRHQLCMRRDRMRRIAASGQLCARSRAHTVPAAPSRPSARAHWRCGPYPTCVHERLLSLEWNESTPRTDTTRDQDAHAPLLTRG